MKILVCISHVPDTTSKITFIDNEKFDTNGVQFIINPLDEFCLTRAIWFKENEGATITVINVGPSETEPTLRKALAIGADEAIRIDAIPTDGVFVANQIAEYVKNNPFDIVFTGKESIDYNGKMVPAILSSLINYNFIDNCNGMDKKDDKFIVQRETESGSEYYETYSPVVIAGQKGLVTEDDLKIPNMRGIMTARSKPLNVVEATKFESQTNNVSFSKESKQLETKFFDSENLNELVDLIQKEVNIF